MVTEAWPSISETTFTLTPSLKRSVAHRRKLEENNKKSRLANKALWYLQREEVLGRTPTPKDLFGKYWHARLAEETAHGAILSTNLEEAWDRYVSIIYGTLTHYETKKESVRVANSRKYTRMRTDENGRHGTPKEHWDRHQEGKPKQVDASEDPP